MKANGSNVDREESTGIPGAHHPASTMSKRELIAAMAMQGLVDRYGAALAETELARGTELSVAIGDALLAKLNETPARSGEPVNAELVRALRLVAGAYHDGTIEASTIKAVESVAAIFQMVDDALSRVP